ncbi:MAG: SHOCT domain-containing protein [Lachnospiraceae bacterium]|nr:SHOCT domain-containing protein [Lachnospiraceae bacterium]
MFDSNYFSIGYLIGYFLGLLIWGILMGCATKVINESKGYSGGFAWGFWLGLIGLIVVACKSNKIESNPSYSNSSQSTMETESKEKQISESMVIKNDDLDVFSKIEKIASLKEKGVISEEEFEEKKKELLNKL